MTGSSSENVILLLTLKTNPIFYKKIVVIGTVQWLVNNLTSFKIMLVVTNKLGLSNDVRNALLYDDQYDTLYTNIGIWMYIV